MTKAPEGARLPEGYGSSWAGIALETSRDARIERQLAITQSVAHIGSWEWDVTSARVTWSDELYRIYGFEPGSHPVTLEFFVSRVHPDDRATVEREVGLALARGGRFQWLERIVRPDGSVRKLHTVGEVLRGPEEGASVLVGTCRDVTEEHERNHQIQLYADIVRHVQIGLTVWSVDRADDPESIRLRAYNPAAEAVAGASLASSVGESFRTIAPYAAGGEVEALLASVARDRGTHEASILRSKDPSQPTRALAAKGFPLPGGAVGLALEDVTQSTIERLLQAAEHRVLEKVARGAPLAESLSDLAVAVEEHAPPVIASILLLEPDGRRLRHGAGPSLPEAYRRDIDGRVIGPRAGSCGTAAFLKAPVIVTDIETDALWDDYRELARRHHLRACWSFPILSTHARAIGTFAFYYRTPRTPTERDLAAIARATRLAGIAIERTELEAQLRELSGHIDAAIEEERTGIAREIHDELGQALTALKMDVAWIVRRLSPDTRTPPREDLVEKLRAMSGLVDGMVSHVRKISAELRPGVLDDLGPVAAIEWQAQVFEERTGTACVVRSNASTLKIDRAVATTMFRAFQEALTNVTRHAEATRVEVDVDVRDHLLSLRVKDDGKGISVEALHSPKSLGLLGMRERAHRLGGTARVEPIEPHGTLVSLELPVTGRGATP